MTQNEILFIMDSVGFPEFLKASTPNCDSIGKLQKAYALATYTMPSVYAMLRGSLPQPHPKYTPYKCYTEYSEHSIIPMNLKNRGYKTYLCTSNPNITVTPTKLKSDVVSYHPYFQFEHKNFDKMPSGKNIIDWFLKYVEEPFFAVFLLIETHTPYMGKNNKRKTQIEAIEYLDECIGHIKKNLDYDARVIITADHSEAWNDDNTSHRGHNPSNYYYAIHDYSMLKRLLEVPLIEGYINAANNKKVGESK
jgi:hypothetical protein